MKPESCPKGGQVEVPIQELDFFELFGANENISEAELKALFRRMANILHPDHTGGDEAKFEELYEVYELFSDPQKRATYFARRKAINDNGIVSKPNYPHLQEPMSPDVHVIIT